VLAAIDQVCLLYPVDRERVALAGMSAGASMGALLATRYPQRFKAVVMHSGVPPGAADSAASVIGAMRGRRGPVAPVALSKWPPLLVIHGSGDRVVAAANGAASARLWASAAGAETIAVRRVQRGARYPMTITEFRSGGRAAATLCEVEGLGHAWSGGDVGERFSDERGPDASRMVWAFMLRQFKAELGKAR
jgi:poly(3-hydroxybutyrate) depolymerase